MARIPRSGRTRSHVITQHASTALAPPQTPVVATNGGEPSTAESNSQVQVDVQTSAKKEEGNMVEKTKEPVVITLPSWVGAFSLWKIINPTTVLLLIIIGAMGYTLYTHRESVDDVVPEKVDVEVVSNYDFGDLEPEQVDAIKAFVTALVAMPEKEFKGKARVLTSFDPEAYKSDEERVAALNDALTKQYRKDASDVVSTLATVIEMELTKDAGSYMTAIAKKKPKRK